VIENRAELQVNTLRPARTFSDGIVTAGGDMVEPVEVRACPTSVFIRTLNSESCGETTRITAISWTATPLLWSLRAWLLPS
jgi:hypothetical protein